MLRCHTAATTFCALALTDSYARINLIRDSVFIDIRRFSFRIVIRIEIDPFFLNNKRTLHHTLIDA